MTVEVELFNRQSVLSVLTVTGVDEEGPRLVDSRIMEDRIILYVEDDGIGVDFREIFAVGTSVAVYAPVSWNTEDGSVVFEYPGEDWDVYVPDHIGNMLHLSVTLGR